jgi:hypothetical protein
LDENEKRQQDGGLRDDEVIPIPNVTESSKGLEGEFAAKKIPDGCGDGPQYPQNVVDMDEVTAVVTAVQ